MTAAVVYFEHALTPSRREILPLKGRGRVRDYDPKWQRPYICLVNGKPLLRDDWDKPILDDEIVVFIDVNAIPQGGDGGSDPLRAVLLIAVMVAAPYAGAYLAGTMGITSAIGTQLVTAAVSFAGTALVNAVVPPPKPPTPQSANALAAPSPTYNLQAQGNVARLEQAIPEHFGRMIAYPDFAAMPYTEYVGNEQYLYQLLALGRGEYDIEQIRIEDTPITSFKEIQYEVVPPHGQVTLFPANVHTSSEVSGQELTESYTRLYVKAEVRGRSSNNEGPFYLAPGSYTATAEVVGYLDLSNALAENPDYYWSVDIYAVAADNTKIKLKNVLIKDYGGSGSVADPATATITSSATTGAPLGPFAANAPGTQANHIGVDFVCPKGLYYANDNGSLSRMSVRVIVEAREIDDNGAPVGGWFGLGDHTYSAATNSPQRFSERYAVAPGRYEVRAYRVTPKNTSTRAGHDISWTALRAYLPDTRDYGDVTLIAMRMRATNNLSQQASRKINVIATRRLPIWDGTAWSAPQPTRSIAWAFAYACKQMGLNDAQIDLAELLRLDGVWAARGDTFDARFDNSMTFWEALTKIAQAGRAKPFMHAGVMRIMRDEPATVPVALYSVRNIVKGSLSVDYLMPTVDTADAVDVGYFDADFWAPRRVRAVLPDSQAQKPAKVDLFGVVNREQAYREGIYQAASNRYRRKLIKFATEMEGFIPSYGDLIYIQHDMPAWGQGGEIVAWDAATLTVTTSEPLQWEAGQTHYMALRTADGGIDGPYQVTQGANEHEVVFAVAPVVTPYTGGDRERTHYSFGWANTWRQPARVISVRPRDALTVEIEAVGEDDAVHTADQGVFAPSSPTSQLKAEDTVPAVTGFDVQPVTVSKFTASWQASPGAHRYIIEQSGDGETWTRLAELAGTTYSGSVDYADHSFIRIAAAGLAQGPWTQVSFGDILREPLPDVTGLSVVYRDGVPYLTWQEVSDPPRQGIGYEVRKGAAWEGAEIIGRTFNTEIQALGAGTYWVRAYHGPAWSLNPTGVITTGALKRNVIASFDHEAAGWPGVYDTGLLTTEYSDLVMTGTGLFDDIADFDGEVSIDHFGPVAAEAIYELPANQIIDVGQSQPCLIDIAYRGYVASKNATWDDIADFDAAPSVDGVFSNDGSVTVQLSVADDALNWGPWFDYTPGTYVGRAFKARVVLRSNSPDIYAAIDRFTWTVDMPDKTERGDDITVPAAGLTVDFNSIFNVVPNIQITVQNAQNGDTVSVMNKTKTGFTVQVLNGGTGVERIIDWVAQGY